MAPRDSEDAPRIWKDAQANYQRWQELRPDTRQWMAAAPHMAAELFWFAFQAGVSNGAILSARGDLTQERKN